jgi:predicted porin
MKRSLFALAALTAFAGAASAQSSVTLFGVVDVNMRQVNNTDDMSMLSTDGNASSRLGFRGVEDLGGGLRAGFWLEGALGADDGNASLGGQNWRRRSTVSLIGNFGEVRLGRDYTPTFWNWTTFDPFGTNGVGSSTNLGLESGRSQGAGGSYGTLVRADNTVGYFLPANLGGLYGQFMVAAGEGTPGNKFYGGRLGYSAGAFNVAGAWGETQVNRQDDDGTNWNIAGSYNFGFMTLSGFYGEVDVQDVTQSNWFIGATVPFGAFTFKASYGAVDSIFLRQVDDADADQFAIGAVYDLSKRTALYGHYSYINNTNSAFRVAGTVNSAGVTTAGPNLNVGDSSAGFEVGIRHSF